MHLKKIFLSGLFIFSLAFVFTITVYAETPPPPYVPLSTFESLDEISFSSEGSGYMFCHTETGLSECEIRGQYWTFKVPWENETKGNTDLKAWLSHQKITIIVEKEHSIYAYTSISNQEEYYFRFFSEDDVLNCEISRKITLKPGQPLHFELSETTPFFYFYSTHDGKKSQSLQLHAKDLETGSAESYREIGLHALFHSKSGRMTHDIDFVHNLSNIEGNTWEVQNIPQFPGQYIWSIALDYSAVPIKNMTVDISQGLPLPELKNGDTLGGLLVKNVPFGSATAVPEYGDSFSFPGFYESSYIADVTPQGDALFWLPPGMWTINVGPDESFNVTYLQSHFIAVQPGKMSIVEWPKSLNQAFNAGDTQKLKILSARADTSKGKLVISLPGSDKASIIPSPLNLGIIEGGQKGKVTDVKRLKTPADIVLLLDSSGSMKGQMKQAIAATRAFVKNLPGDTRIRIIDFDTKPKLLKGSTAKSVLTSLKKVKANGATALYDSILKGLSLVEQSNRPALVVFTDGVDANYNDTAPGSKATQKEVLEAVKTANVPVFTIGFGVKSDVNTLSRIAEISNGSYYIAEGEDELKEVFNAIDANLGSQYQVTYSRPKISSASNRPVISIMVDNSGSMDSWPDVCTGCDRRLEKTRQILSRFVKDLPDDYLIQIATFSGEVIVNQVLTGDKLAALRAISMMEARSTTDILGSMETALKTLKPVPSNQRFLVYIADLALSVNDDEKEAFDAILGKIKDARISTMFIGMVDEDVDGAYAHAAKLTDGKFVISTDLDKVARAFAELSEQIKGTPIDDGRSTIRVALNHRSENGKNLIFSAARHVTFPKKQKSGEIAQPESVIVRPGYRLKPYDPAIAKLLSGNDVMVKDVRIIKRMPLDTSQKNKAVKIKLTEALSLSRLRKIDSPDNLRFYALTMTFENILPKQKVAIYPDGANHPAAWAGGNDVPLRYEERIPTYVIPDIQKHLFLRWNNQRSFPVSEATWLAETPLTLPGDEALAVEANQVVTGTLIFMVPTQHMKQVSLHLYDTNWGHIDIPISGTIELSKEVIEKLPVKAPVKLSDTFSMQITGTQITDKIDFIEAQENMKFLILDADFQSNMQAHIDLKPVERFQLKLPTEKGSLFFKVHPVTRLLPLGFYRPTMFTPGSKNPVRMVFRIPEKFIDHISSAEIVIDLAGGGITIPLSDSPKIADYKGDYDARGQGVAVKIFKTGSIEEVFYIGNNLLVVEAVISDIKDNKHSQVGELLILKNKKFDPVKAAAIEKDIEKLRMEAATLPNRGLANFGQTTLKVLPGMATVLSSEAILLFGIDEETIIPDGHTRRGLFFFRIPPETQYEDWTISSLVVENLAVEPVNEPFADTSLFATRLDDEDEAGSSFWDEMTSVIARLTAQREATGFIKPGGVRSKKVSPDKDQEQGASVPAIAISTAGKADWQRVRTLAQLKEQMTRIHFLPSEHYAPWMMKYSPEAVFTQGWGTESDIARLAEIVLSRMGFKSTRIAVDLTDAGKSLLSDLAGVSTHKLEKLPALEYVDDKGKNHILVAPFLQDASQLKNQIFVSKNFSVEDNMTETVSIKVELLVKPTGSNKQKQLVDITDVLAGDAKKNEIAITVLSESFNIDVLSSDAVDIGYTKSIQNGTTVYQAVLDSPEGRLISDSDYSINTADYSVLGEVIEIRTEARIYTRTRYLDEKTDITGLFHTIGINLPDLPRQKASFLTSEMKKNQASVTGKPDVLSTLKWYTRGLLYRFIAAQSKNEKELSKTLELVTGRVKEMRVLMATVQKDTSQAPLYASMDLIYPHTQILKTPDEKATHAFNIMAGMANTRFEAIALGQHGHGFFEIMAQCPQDTILLTIDESSQSEFISILKEKKYPETIINHMENLYDKVIFFPSNPAVINNKLRWAWLEFNTKNYQLVSVMDSGENGAMVEKFIGNVFEQGASYMIGAFIGVDSSIWAVSAVSLEEDDYNKIIKKAKEIVKGISKNLGLGVSGKTYGVSYGIGVGGKASVGVGRAGSYSISPTGRGFGNSALGFGNGFKDGANYYFSKAE